MSSTRTDIPAPDDDIVLADLLATSAHEARLRFDPDSPVADGRSPFDVD